VGSQQGRKAFCLQSLPPVGSLEASSARVEKVAGFSLHAGMAAARHERQKLERLCLQFCNSWTVYLFPQIVLESAGYLASMSASAAPKKFT
jgi:hypothetical protein